MELHGRELADEFCLKMPDFHVTFRDLLHAVNLRRGTDGFTCPPKEGVLRIFFALKNPAASVGFEPANLGTKGQHATSRPPKPLLSHVKDGTIHGISCICDIPARNLMLKTVLKGCDGAALHLGLPCRSSSILEKNAVFGQLDYFLPSVEHVGRLVLS